MIYNHPLHIQTLSRMEVKTNIREFIENILLMNQVETRGCCSLFLDLATKLGRDDVGHISDQVTINNKIIC